MIGFVLEAHNYVNFHLGEHYQYYNVAVLMVIFAPVLISPKVTPSNLVIVTIKPPKFFA